MKEKRELEYKRQVYELAKLRKQQQEELDRRDEYRMPTAYDTEGQNQSKRYEVLTARYRCCHNPLTCAFALRYTSLWPC